MAGYFISCFKIGKAYIHFRIFLRFLSLDMMLDKSFKKYRVFWKLNKILDSDWVIASSYWKYGGKNKYMVQY